MNTIRQAQRAGALWAVLIVAFGLRVYGFWFGLPYVLTGDGENAFIVPAVEPVTYASVPSVGHSPQPVTPSGRTHPTSTTSRTASTSCALR